MGYDVWQLADHWRVACPGAQRDRRKRAVGSTVTAFTPLGRSSPHRIPGRRRSSTGCPNHHPGASVSLETLARRDHTGHAVSGLIEAAPKNRPPRMQ